MEALRELDRPPTQRRIVRAIKRAIDHDPFEKEVVALLRRWIAQGGVIVDRVGGTPGSHSASS